MANPEFFKRQNKLIASGSGPDCMVFIREHGGQAMVGKLIERINKSGDDVLPQINKQCVELLEFYHDGQDREDRAAFYSSASFFNNLVSNLNVNPNNVLDLVSGHFEKHLENRPGAALLMREFIRFVPGVDLHKAHKTLVNYASRFFQPLDDLNINISGINYDFDNAHVAIEDLQNIDPTLGFEPVLASAVDILNAVKNSDEKVDNVNSHVYLPFFNNNLLSLIEELKPDLSIQNLGLNHLIDSFNNQYVLSGGKASYDAHSMSFTIAYAIEQDIFGEMNNIKLYSSLMQHYDGGDKTLVETLNYVAEATDGKFPFTSNLVYLEDALQNPDTPYDADELMGALDKDMQAMSNSQPKLEVISSIERQMKMDSPYVHEELQESLNKDVENEEAKQAELKQGDKPTNTGPGVS
jgi:hypothetical protein